MKKSSPPFIGFIQALGLSFYCSLIGIVFWNVDNWFDNVHSFLGPFAMLSLFVVSALVCALITLGYPFIVFWDKKNTKQALQLVLYTAIWLLLFVAITFTIFALYK